MYIINRKFKFFYKYMIYFILWHENNHISLVATATHELFIFIPLNKNKSCIYRKNLNILYVCNIWHASEWKSIDCWPSGFKAHQDQAFVSMSKKLYIQCLLLVGSRNGLEDVSISLQLPNTIEVKYISIN
jgi:hypothetical protein